MAGQYTSFVDLVATANSARLTTEANADLTLVSDLAGIRQAYNVDSTEPHADVGALQAAAIMASGFVEEWAAQAIALAEYDFAIAAATQRASYGLAEAAGGNVRDRTEVDADVDYGVLAAGKYATAMTTMQFANGSVWAADKGAIARADAAWVAATASAARDAGYGTHYGN